MVLPVGFELKITRGTAVAVLPPQGGEPDATRKCRMGPESEAEPRNGVKPSPDGFHILSKHN